MWKPERFHQISTRPVQYLRRGLSGLGERTGDLNEAPSGGSACVGDVTRATPPDAANAAASAAPLTSAGMSSADGGGEYCVADDMVAESSSPDAGDELAVDVVVLGDAGDAAR